MQNYSIKAFSSASLKMSFNPMQTNIKQVSKQLMSSK